jgi:hypothetical protein
MGPSLKKYLVPLKDLTGKRGRFSKTVFVVISKAEFEIIFWIG